jgi:hypothetical protein
MPSKQKKWVKKWLITENDSAPAASSNQKSLKEEDDHEDPKKWTHSLQ